MAGVCRACLGLEHVSEPRSWLGAGALGPLGLLPRGPLNWVTVNHRREARGRGQAPGLVSGEGTSRCAHTEGRSAPGVSPPCAWSFSMWAWEDTSARPGQQVSCGAGEVELGLGAFLSSPAQTRSTALCS